MSLILALCIGVGLSGMALAKEPSKKEQQAEVRSIDESPSSNLIPPGEKRPDLVVVSSNEEDEKDQ